MATCARVSNTRNAVEVGVRQEIFVEPRLLNVALK
jgi:hypothetical protein